MGPYKRNWFVGGTVLLGLVTLGFLIILFGGSLGKLFAGEKIGVTFRSDRGDGLSDGSAIRYLGQQVGTVKRIDLVLDESPNHVLIRAELDKVYRLPHDVTADIRIPNFLGSGAIIELAAAPGPATAFLAGGETIDTKYVGLGVLPPEFGQLATEMRDTVKQFREADVVGDVKATLANLNARVAQVGKVLDSIDAVLGSEATQTDLKTAIAKFREATEHANNAAANVERISAGFAGLPAKVDATMDQVQAGVADARGTITDGRARVAAIGDQLARNLDTIAGVLDDVRQITEKVNGGKGTIGLLVNDPKLYDTIVTATEVINETVKDVQRLIRGIEQEGFPIDLK